MKDYLLARLSERSTWAGLATVATLVLGHTISDSSIEYIVNIGVGVTGLLAVFFRESQ